MKLSKYIYLLLLGSSCTVLQKQQAHNLTKFQDVYSVTITEDDFHPIYNFLNSLFKDFPDKKSRIIRYCESSESLHLKIRLTKKNLKVDCKSNKKNEFNFEALKFQINKIIKK